MTRFAVRSLFLSTAVVLFVRPLAAEEPKLHFPADRPVDMKHIRLDLRIDLDDKRADARATLDMAALRDLSNITLNAVGFETKEATVSIAGGPPQPCKLENDGEKITLKLPEPLPRGRDVTATIDYTVKDPEAGLYFCGPTDDEPDAPKLAWTQGESITNRYWVPCFDHPNEMQTTEIAVTVDQPNIAISNGKLVEETKNADGTTTFHWLQDKPNVCHLYSFVVGTF